MKYLRPNALQLNCFSPPVMIVTFAVEVALAVYTVWRYKLTPVARLAVALLICLATFQLAEFMVCEGAWLVDSLAWAKIGYVAITLLPPLGIHLTARLSGDARRWPLVAAYAGAAVFSAYFLFISGGVSYGQCLGNYVIFEQPGNTVTWYAAYYYGLLLAGIGYALHRAKTAAPRIRRALYWLAGGYAAFIVPTTIANTIDPETIRGIPSIMCGFAVILAVVLSGGVLTNYYKKPYLIRWVYRARATDAEQA